MRKLLGIVIPLVLLAGMSLACGLNPLKSKNLATDIPATLEALAGELEPTAAPADSEGGGAEPTAAATAEGSGAGEEELDLSSVSSGLENLDSYSTYLEISTLINGATSPTGTLVMETQYVREPLAERVVMRGGESEEAIEMVQIGDQQYMLLGAGQCMSTQADEGDTLGTGEMQPDDLVGGLEGAKRVLPDETVNGVLCRHYRFDEKSLTGLSVYSSAQGEAWVAVDGNYVVKYVLQATSSASDTGEVTDYSMVYELREVNSGLTIEPPADCGAGASEYPMMADATDVTSMSGLVMYETASPLADVIAFYQEQMPAQGWAAADEEPTITDEMGLLSFTKDGQTASVMISTSDEGPVSVMISVEGPAGEAAPAN